MISVYLESDTKASYSIPLKGSLEYLVFETQLSRMDKNLENYFVYDRMR